MRKYDGGLAFAAVDGCLAPYYSTNSSSISKKDTDIPFSSSELEVLKLVIDGLTSKKMGENLNLSGRTGEWYRQNLMTKANTGNAAELTAWASKQGYVE